MNSMKKHYLLFSFAAAFSLITADLQAADGDKVGGLRFGYHSSNLAKDGTNWGDPVNSFYVGFTRDNQIIPLLHIGTGLEYFKNGVNLTDGIQRDFHYLSVPISAKLKLGPVFAQTGFAPSFKVAERYVTDGNSEKPSDDMKAEWFDIPFFVGAGVKIWMLTLEARYHWGLLEVTDGYKSQYFQLGLGLSF
jgi:hypothetical protein